MLSVPLRSGVVPGRSLCAPWGLMAVVILAALALPRVASAVPSFARQTGMPCSQCHTLSFGPPLTAYGRQFKLNGYTFGEGEHPLPVALMVQGGAPYWRAAYQFSAGEHRDHYFSFGTFGMDVTLQPDPTVPDTNRYTDIALDGTYQYTPEGPGSIIANASVIHEKQRLTATFNALGADNATNHLTALEVDASYAWRQTWSAGLGFFDIRGGRDATLYAPGAFSGSANGSPDTRGVTVQFECVPLGKLQSWGRPWVNLRVGVQYTAYLKFNGGTTSYDVPVGGGVPGRNASQNNSLFLFSWMAF